MIKNWVTMHVLSLSMGLVNTSKGVIINYVSIKNAGIIYSSSLTKPPTKTIPITVT